jgi:cytosine/adenosine deaminase-related metal-dependent hydrolase
MRLAHFLHGGFGFERTIGRFDWVLKTVKDGRFATDAPGDGALEVGSPADILVLDLDRLDGDAITAVEPIDVLFGRGSQAHILHMIVAGEDIVRDGQLATLDLAASEARVRQLYRERMPGREPFFNAWRELEPSIRDFYLGTLGCC